MSTKAVLLFFPSVSLLLYISLSFTHTHTNTNNKTMYAAILKNYLPCKEVNFFFFTFCDKCWNYTDYHRIQIVFRLRFAGI
jgi:hypothetical protein